MYIIYYVHVFCSLHRRKAHALFLILEASGKNEDFTPVGGLWSTCHAQCGNTCTPGMSLRRFSEDVATAARLSSAAFAHAALAGGCDKALPFRGAMGLEAHSSLARRQEAWPTVNGLPYRPDDAAEWAGRMPNGKALRMAALQRAISHADADARTAAL